MTPPPKYGCELTNEQWRGVPLRVGHFQGAGRVTDLTASADTVLVWSGGRSEVTVHARRERGQPVSSHQFVRHSGMIDLMPQGTVLEQVDWQGQRQGCVSAIIPSATARELSTLVGTWFGSRLLRESSGPWRIAGAVLIVAGVISLALPS